MQFFPAHVSSFTILLVFITFSYICSIVNSSAESTYLFIKTVPTTLHSGSSVTILHSCHPSWRVIGVIDIQLYRTSSANFVYKAFSHECSDEMNDTFSSTNVTLFLPRYFGCQPQYWLERPPTPHRVRLRLWLEDSTTRHKCTAHWASCYKYARERISYTTRLPPPADRKPCLHFEDACASGFHLLRAWSWRPNHSKRCSKVAGRFPYTAHLRLSEKLELKIFFQQFQ